MLGWYVQQSQCGRHKYQKERTCGWHTLVKSDFERGSKHLESEEITREVRGPRDKGKLPQARSLLLSGAIRTASVGTFVLI